MLKKILIPLVLFLFLSSGASAQNANADYSIGVLIKTTKHQFWRTIEKGIEQAAEKHGINTFVMGNIDPNDGQEQLNKCETMLLKKPDAMIVAAVNLTNLQPCLTKAANQGILIVDIDGNITKESAEEFGLNIAFSVAADNKLLGQKAGEYLQGQSGKVLILEGLPGSLPSIQRKEGFLEYLPEGLEVIASLPTDWDRLKANDITNSILLQHPDLKVIFAAADTMAIGAYEAAKKYGNEKELIIIGIDGNAEAIEAIKSEKMDASIAQLPILMAEQALLKTVRSLEGEDIEFEQYLPALTLTKEMLEKEDEPLLKYLK